MAGQVFSNPGGYLLLNAGTGVAVTGTGVDMRACKNYAYLFYASYSPSAILRMDASHDNTGWLTVMTVTATPSSGTAQISAFYPYVRASVVTGYSTTGSANLFYQPGVV